MVIQNKIFSFKIKRQAKNVFPSDVERTVVYSSKGYILKAEEVFLLSIDLFSEGAWYTGKHTEVHKSYLLCYGGQTYKIISVDTHEIQQ